jgi:hypothetical protein
VSELRSGSYEATAVEQAPSVDASYEAEDGQARATDGRAGEESGELLTRDEYAAQMEQDNPAGDDVLDEHVEEADLASIDAYDQADGETYEPLIRDEYAELIDQDSTGQEDAPEHIEEADLAVIDAYDTALDPDASRAQDEEPGEAPGGTLTERVDHDTDPPETEDARCPDVDQAETRETDAERISALEAEKADLRQQLVDLRASNDARMDRFEQELADLKRQSGRPQSSENADEEPVSGPDQRAAPDARLERTEQGDDQQPAEVISSRERDTARLPEEKTELEHERLPSDTRLAFGGTVAGIVLGAVAEHVSPGVGQTMVYVGDGLSLSIGALAVWRENRKRNDGRRPKG